MAKLQSPNYLCKTKGDVVKEFGNPAVEWKLSKIEDIEKLFGTCEVPDFTTTKTTLVALPGFGEKGDVTKKIRMHKALEKSLISAFTEIKDAKLGYILWEDQVWGQTFRYKKNTTTNTYIKNRPEYEHLKKAMKIDDWNSWGWAIKAAAYDAQNGKLGELIDIGSKKVTKKSLLSNHAWGTAIDINSGFNDFSPNAHFDMNKKIIEILAKYGFRWGGYYHDYMHFEYVLDHLPDSSEKPADSPPKTTIFFPIDLGKGIECSDANIALYYDKTEKDSPGGYFPVGTNTVWHGGVHIYGKEKDLIHACFDGKIIGARLGDQPATSEGHYGSRNLILLEHTIGSNTLYCLFMHLYSKAINESELDKLGVKWIKPEGVKKIFYTVASGKTASYRSAPGVKSNPNSKELGKAKAGERMDHLGIEKDPDGDPWIKVKFSNGTTGYIYEKRAADGTLVRHEETVPASGPGILSRLKSGKLEKLDISIKAGEPIWVMGSYGSPGSQAALLHWEFFSKENLLAGVHDCAAIEDLDDDYNMDCSTILQLFKKYQNTGWWNDDEVLEQDELKKFFTTAPERIQLRNYACKFTSEWGILNLDAAISSLKDRWFTFGLKDRIKPYVFWPEAVSAGVKIPGSASVWHFNPIRILVQFGKNSTTASSEPSSNQSNSQPLPQPTDNIHTDWKKGFNRNITDQNKFNEYIYNSTKDRNINPYIFKSLIAQESGFDPKARNNGGFAGLTQVGGAAITTAGFNIGNTKKVNNKWEYDLTGDERFIPQKSIEGGAKVFAAKMKSVNTLVFKNYTTPLPDEEEIKFYLAAYNGGEGTVQKAYKACGVVNAKWEDLIKGKETSGLWAAIPESWDRESKYKEITQYVSDIIARATQDNSAGSPAPAPTAQSSQNQTSLFNSTELKKGNFDDIAVAKYSSKNPYQTGYVQGKKIEQLQKDLISVGIKEVGSADGDFGTKTEAAVKKFQQYALQEGRQTVSSCVMVKVTYKGHANGIADKATIDELELWLFNGYLIPENTNANDDNNGFIFPLSSRPSVSYKDGGRFFGANRSNGRKHAGCDLIAPTNTPIYAIGDGVVIQKEYSFYEGTNALEIKHGNYVVRYGEILPGSASSLSAGTKVTKGQQIAKVGLLNSGSHMLHFEMYSGSATGQLTNRSNPPYQRRKDLIDPAPFLDKMKLKG
ncbi:MAG: peptidoglycan DD-metalloendopeptidase family protein [Fibrobacter sp.]|nr:peptidoglycan DD-metalloendopeptidase family protein [Fibrobacter sp.]